MDIVSSKYKSFNDNINRFIDKYYKNLLIRGTILFLLLAAAIVIVVSTVEYLAWFNLSGRLFLFLFTLISSGFIFFHFFLTPLFRFLGIFKRISNTKTAQILTDNIPELKDYVFNVLELKNTSDNNINTDLVDASLLQKLEYISKYDFLPVISVKSIKGLLKYSLTIIFIYILIFSFKPDVIIQGSNRIIHFNNHYVKNLGYKYILDSTKLTVEKGNNLDINVKLLGSNFPSYLSVFIGNNEFLMEKFKPDSFAISIKSVNSSFNFRVGTNIDKSGIYKATVINPPFLNTFKIIANYPKYTTKQSETFTRISNLKVPIGTQLSFQFEVSYVDSLFFLFDTTKFNFTENKNLFLHEITILKSIKYNVVGVNSNMHNNIVSNSFISSISDLYPQIKVELKSDKFNHKIVYFKGIITDDYGFTNLYFICNNIKTIVPINNNLKNQEFYFSYEFSDTIQTKFNYYFEVFDNDNINGFKGSKSVNFEYIFPDYNELLSKKNKENEEVIRKIEKSLLLAQEFKKDIFDIKKKMISENLSSFEKKQFLKDLQNKQNTLEDLLQQFSQQNREKNNNFNSFSQQNDELLNKQDQIQKLLDVVMDDELKKLLEELQELSEQDNINRDLDKLEMNYDNLSDQLDKNLELLKKFEVERDLTNLSQQLEELSGDQKKLSDDILTINAADSLMKKNIEQIKNLVKQFSKILDNNSDLDSPMTIDDLADDFDSLKRSIEESRETNSENSDTKTKKQKKDKFSENSKDAKKLADQIQSLLNNNSSNESSENASTLRQILENLFYFSFKQEDIYSEMKYSLGNSPLFVSSIRKQSSQNITFSIIKDSLYQLSKRTPYLGNHINKKVFAIESCLFDIDDYIKLQNYSKLYLCQRYVIQYSNDLILLLSESLKNMESSGSGSGSSQSKSKKKKPQKGEPSLSEMRKTQESMKSQLQSMIEQMKAGKGKSGKSNSEQLGKMLSQQEIFQNSLNRLKNSQDIGTEATKQLNEINKLIEQNKRDIINNSINKQSVLRQQQILTRLLQAENAKMERDLDNKRESNEALNYIRSNPSELFNKQSDEIIFDDILKNSSIKLNYYFRHKYQQYIKNLN